MITIRRARPEDVQEIIALANSVFRPPDSGLSPSMGMQYPLFLSEQNAQNLFIAEDNGRIVAHNGTMPGAILINGHPISMSSMGSVCTHPDYRGQGIGTRVLMSVLDSLREEGLGLLAISGGRGLYTRNGAAHTAGYLNFTIASESYAAEDSLFADLTDVYSVAYSEYCEETVSTIADEIAALYQAESVRYLRTRREFPILLKAAPGAQKYPPDRLIAMCSIGKSAAAYTIGYRQEDDVLRVVEYAGDRLAVGFLVHRMLSDKAVQKLSLDVPTYDRQLAAYLEACEFRGSSRPYASTFMVTNASALWNQVRPIIEERLSECGAALSLNQLPVNCNEGQELLHFLFDAHQRKTYGQPWDSVLPIPLPWVNGLNYI